MPRPCFLVVACLVAACGDGASSDPSRVRGGGLAGPPLDGTLHVFVVDAETDAPLAGAAVRAGTAAGPVAAGATGDEGSVTLSAAGLTGAVPVTATRDGFVETTVIDVTRESVTIPLEGATGEAATVTGTIPGFDARARRRPSPARDRLGERRRG